MGQPVLSSSFRRAGARPRSTARAAIAVLAFAWSSALAQGVSGDWAVGEGRSLRGKQFTGTVVIRPSGGAYSVRWALSDGSYDGVGIERDGRFAAMWFGAAPAGFVCLYRLTKGGLEGLRFVAGGSGKIVEERAAGRDAPGGSTVYSLEGHGQDVRPTLTLGPRRPRSSGPKVRAATWSDAGGVARGIAIEEAGWLAVSAGGGSGAGLAAMVLFEDELRGIYAGPGKTGHGLQWLLRSQAEPTPADCASSNGCRLSGDCTPKAGFSGVACRPGSDGDCKQSEACRKEGRCTYVLAAGSQVLEETDRFELWSEDQHICAKDPESACGGTTGCSVLGLCHFLDGRCIARSREDCDGKCGDGRPCFASGGRCITSGCEKTDGCRDGGYCSVRGQECVAATRSDCAGSRFCKEHGRCTARDGECAPGSDADCRRSLGCRKGGTCRLVFVPQGYGGNYGDVDRYVCTRDPGTECSSSSACSDKGMCSARNGRCVLPSTRADCANGCAETGMCTPVRGICLAATDADCANSEVCGREGLCSPVQGWCLATTDDECRESSQCGSDGRCVARRGQCIDPKTEGGRKR